MTSTLATVSGLSNVDMMRATRPLAFQLRTCTRDGCMKPCHSAAHNFRDIVSSYLLLVSTFAGRAAAQVATTTAPGKGDGGSDDVTIGPVSLPLYALIGIVVGAVVLLCVCCLCCLCCMAQPDPEDSPRRNTIFGETRGSISQTDTDTDTARLNALRSVASIDDIEDNKVPLADIPGWFASDIGKRVFFKGKKSVKGRPTVSNGRTDSFV